MSDEVKPKRVKKEKVVAPEVAAEPSAEAEKAETVVAEEAPEPEVKEKKVSATPVFVVKKGKFTLYRCGEKHEVHNSADQVISRDLTEDAGRKLVSDLNRS